MSVQYNKILPGSSSFQLVRSNPKLTGNVKVTVDSQSNVWLNSIDANDELSKDMYKRVPVDVTKGHETNLYSFFNDGETPSEIVFDLKEKVNTNSTSLRFEDQYDFSNYFSGVKYLVDRRYTEKFSFFAPIYLKKDLPECFVIIKIKGPMEGNVSSSKSSYPIDKNEYIKGLLSKSEIVKVFDLSAESKIGTYIRNIINNPLFPDNPLEVNFEKDRFSHYNGIAYKTGAFASSSENLFSFFQEGYPIRAFEEYITLGYQRNNIIFPNIINLEFLFDDNTAQDYEFNRYLGFYCNLIELDDAIFDTETHYDLRLNEPRFKTRYQPDDDLKFTQSNADGLEFYFKLMKNGVSNLSSAFSDDENIFFSYVQGKDKNLHLIKPGSISYLSSDTGKLTLTTTKTDIGTLFGPGEVFIEDEASVFIGKSQSFSEIEILSNFKTGDSVKLYHPGGTKKIGNLKYDEFIAVEGYNDPDLNNPGDFYSYRVDSGTGDIYYFNCLGTSEEVTSALLGCINSVRYRPFVGLAYKNRLWVKINSPGNHDSQFSFEYTSLNNNTWDVIKINGKTGKVDLDSNKINFIGGDSFGYHLVLDSGHKEKIESTISERNGEPVYDLVVETDKNWVNVIKTAPAIEYITSDDLADPKKAELAVSNYDLKMGVFLEEKAQPKLANKLAQLRKQFHFRIGVLSILDLMDFDFDPYSSTYSRFQEMDIYKDFYVPVGINALNLDEFTYTVVGIGTVEVNGVQYSTGDLISGTGITSYSIISGDPIVIKYNVTPTGDLRLDIPLWDENEELKRFTGFSTIHKQNAVIDNSSIEYQYRDKYIDSALSEYNILNEVNTKDFAIKSQIIPYICKWGYEKSLDVRDNPYRLNTEFIFGQDNFAPNQNEPTANPSRFTHEWFYIESAFDYLNDESLVKKNYFYFDQALDLTAILNDSEEFLNYFAYAPFYGQKEVARTQHRYTITDIEGSTGLYETLFKGFRISFKEISQSLGQEIDGKPSYVRNSDRFKDYKFTALLRVVPENLCSDSTQPIRYRFIEHKDSKFVLLLIDLVLSPNFGDTVIAPNFLSMTPTSPGETEDARVTINNFYDVNPYYNFLPFFYGIFGDYRINIDSNGMSDLSYAFLYYAKNKKYNTLLDSFSNTTLTRKIDFSTSGVYINNNRIFIKSIPNPNIPNWVSQLDEEIRTVDTSALLCMRGPQLSILSQNCFGSEYILSARDGVFSFADSMLDSIVKNDIQITDRFFNHVTGLNTNTSLSNLAISSPTLPMSGPYYGVPVELSYFVPAFNQALWKVYRFFQITGGKDYYTQLFGKLAFSKFKELVNNMSSMIEYESWSFDSNGNAVKSNSNEFYVEIEEPIELVKKSFPSSSPEYLQIIASKPKQTVKGKLTSQSLELNPQLAGYQFVRNQLKSNASIFRYNGGYEPIFKPLIAFKKNFEVEYNSINNDLISLANVRLNLNDPDIFDIKNFNHIKVADTRILLLEEDDRYQPQYPLIGEVPIGRDDMFLLQSNWDWGYHWKYSDKFFKNPVSGTLRIEEDQNFLAKVMNLPFDLEINSFNTEKVTQDIDSVDISNLDLIWQETNTEIIGRINVEKILRDYLFNNGVRSTFNEVFVDDQGNVLTTNNDFLGKLSLTDYINSYIVSNLIPLYDIDGIEFYTKENKNLVSTTQTVGSIANTVSFEFLPSDSERFKQKFSLSRNLQINKSNRLELKFRFSKRLGFSLVISPKLKIRLI